MTEQVLDLRGSLRALRRRWALLVVLCAGGMACGFTYSQVQPPEFVAGYAVRLPPSRLDANGDPLRSIDSESFVATSAEILERVGKALDPPIAADELQRRVQAQPLSVDILEVRAEAPSLDRAALIAESVAKEYVAYANSDVSEQADVSLDALEEQAAELDKRIRRLDKEIASGSAKLAGQDPNSPDAMREAALVDSARSAQVDAARQLSALNTQIAESRLNVELSRRGTRLLGLTTDLSPVWLSRQVRNTGVGGLVGVLAGVILALVVEQRDRKLRTRDEIARAVGAPVLASLRVPGGSSVEHYARLLERWTPSAVENVALRQAFTDLGVTGSGPPANIVVVTLSGDGAALQMAAQLAAFAAAVETPTSFIVATRHATAMRLAAACRQGVARSHLTVRAVAGDVHPDDLRSADLTVAVVVAEPGEGALPTWGRPTVAALAVSSGFATADTLASTALAYLDAGSPFGGVLVANSERGDGTTGRLYGPVTPPGGVQRRREISGASQSEVPVP
ncbi:MAG TPA: hypothetical protein VGR26_11825 [Acidimicrobiales bacterium]|nr:hypothetical protein [Acidimicrobiales bacterium]